MVRMCTARLAFLNMNSKRVGPPNNSLERTGDEAAKARENENRGSSMGLRRSESRPFPRLVRQDRQLAAVRLQLTHEDRNRFRSRCRSGEPETRAVWLLRTPTPQYADSIRGGNEKLIFGQP